MLSYRKISLLTLMMLTLCCVKIAAAENASQLLDKAAEKVRSHKSISVNYTISADNQSQNGTLILSGDRFVLTLPGISSWYDGRTQWTFARQTGEVNMSEPTPEELQQVNPFAIINSFKNSFTPTLLKSDPGEKVISLTSKAKHPDIIKAVLTLNASSLLPNKILLTLSNHKTVLIKINSLTPGGTLPAETFRFDSKKFPGLKVVDLR